MTEGSQTQIGRAPRRREDPRLLTGRGCFTDDVRLEDPLYLGLLRSPVAHGRIRALDLSAALAAPDVVAGVMAQDLGPIGALSINPVLPCPDPPDYPVLASGRVEAVGQPVAAVLARTQLAAADALDAITLDIQEMPVAERRAPTASRQWTSGDVKADMARAHYVAEVVLDHPRLAPSPLEPRAIAVAYDPGNGHVTAHIATQTPHRARSELARMLDQPEDRFTVIAPDVGGAFGMKASLYPEDVLAVWAALRLERSVRWTATRSDDFLAASHGRGLSSRGRLAMDRAGRFLALDAEIQAPLGHWMTNSALIPAWNAARILPSGYDVGSIDIRTAATLSQTAPVGIYRGAGRPEANLLMERLIDEAAELSGIDPLELRRRNLLPPDRLPHTTQTGNILDSGRYADALMSLGKIGGYEDACAARDRRRADGEIVGIGLAFYLEPSGTGWESARVTLDPDGGVLVATGGSAQGQGRETAIAQIAADALGCPPEDITVHIANTATCPPGIGALASRSTPIGGSAIQEACRKALAAGRPCVVDSVYTAEGEAWGYGAYLVQLSIDPQTGVPEIEAVTCVDDAGRIIHPGMVSGQITGGFAQGLGEALLERLVYDADGQLLTGSFMDYAMPRAADIPPLSIHKMETPCPVNLLGAKGVGEAGTIGAPAAILNAAVDALRPYGVTDLQMPLTSETLWRAIHTAKRESLP